MKKTILLLSIVMVVLFASYASADNATINATGSEISPDLIMFCNITDQIVYGYFEYTLYKDNVNISYGEYPGNISGLWNLVTVDAESGSTPVGNWDGVQVANNAIDENVITYAHCAAGFDNCNMIEWLNTSYSSITSVNWIYDVFWTGAGTTNTTLPNDCILGSDLQMSTTSDANGGTSVFGYCWNGTHYKELFNHTDVAAIEFSYMYEGSWEIIYSAPVQTNISTNIFNHTVIEAGSYVFSCRLNDIATQTAWSNSTAYNTTIFNLSVYSEETGKLITDKVNIWLISDSVAENQSINNSFSIGSTLISLNATNYRLIIESSNYTKRNYYFPVDYLSTIGENIDIFLLNKSVGTYSSVKVIDEFGYDVESSIVYIYKTIPIFNQEKVIGILKLNFEGESSFDFVRNTDDYRFIVYSAGGVLLKTTGKTTINKETIKIQTIDISDPYDSFKAYLGANTRLWLTNGTTSNRTANYYFSGAEITYGCVRVWRSLFSQFDEDVCETCLTASSGLVSCDYNYSTSGTYFVAGVVHTDTLNSEQKTDEIDDPAILAKDRIGRIGLFIAFLLWLFALLIFRFSPMIGLIFGAFCLVMLAVTQIILVPVVALISIVIYLIFKGVLISR